MIGFLRGNFVEKTPAKLLIDVNGVGYEVHISLTTYEAIMGKESGKLYTYLHITENAQSLFGFFDSAEKELFLQLISVSGVGAATARMMLSSSKPTELVKYIVEQNVGELIKIKGIGKKTAELLVVSLKDKLKPIGTESQLISTPFAQPKTDAIDALVALGIAKPMAEKAVAKVVAQTQDLELQEIIKQALKNI
jgi:Holliday junction DNA helicase RuvA